MNDTRTPAQLRLHAELEIAEILSTLEQRTGQFVDRLDICDTDVTNINSTRQMLARQVVIELRPAPGSNWVTA